MAIFKILFGTINLIRVAKYKHSTFLTFLRANPKAFPQSPFFISLQILVLVSAGNFQSSWDDRLCQLLCIWVHNLYLNDVFHLSSTIQPWVNPKVPSSVLHMHFSPTESFCSLASSKCHLFSEESRILKVCPQNNSDFQSSIKRFQVQDPPKPHSPYYSIFPGMGGFSSTSPASTHKPS